MVIVIRSIPDQANYPRLIYNFALTYLRLNLGDGGMVRAWEIMRGTDFALDVPTLGKIATEIANGVTPAIMRQDALDILATGNNTLKEQWVIAIGDPNFIVLRRGTDIGSEIQILDETDHILSDAARQRYNETYYEPGGPNVEEALQYSNTVHQQWLDLFNGDINAYAQTHAKHGIKIEEIYGLKRTLISTTSDASQINKFYTPGVGNKYIGVFEQSTVVEQTLTTSGESEYLVVNGTNLLKKIIE